MTVGDITSTVNDLILKGYPITDSCEMVADIDLRTKKESIKIFFEDRGYKFTVTKEIDNANKI